MIKIKEAIVVEGRYDKNTLSQLVDAPILETAGFGIFKDRKAMAFLRQVAQKRGLIILTDSDGAGFVIRNHLKAAIPGNFLKHAYIPDVFGKEKRKKTSAKEGKLGVEGMNPQVLYQALKAAGATIEGEISEVCGGITKQDFTELGLSGGENSSILRAKLKEKLNLPEHLSTNGLLQAVNMLYTLEEIQNILSSLE